jgi:DoxX-like family
MNSKTKLIVGWVLAGLVAALFLFSASGKLMANPDALAMASKFGLDASSFKTLGFVELAAVILFLIPRTGVVGTLLLVAYMGGAIATHLEHGEPFMAQCVISAFIWIVAAFRFPELTSRLMSK